MAKKKTEEEAEESAVEQKGQVEEKVDEAAASETEETPENTEDLSDVQADLQPKRKNRKTTKIKKSKKEKENPLSLAIRLAVESGKVSLGARRAMKEASAGKSRAFIVATRAPQEIKEDVEKAAKGSNIPLVEFEGSTLELGSACGKSFSVAVVSIQNEGSSNILELASKKNSA